MMHRSECDGSADCLALGCECRCHDRCGIPLARLGEPCYRWAGHKDYHRSQYSVVNSRQAAALAQARARATWDNDAAEYSGPITHTAQRPSVRLYSEREGVGFREYRPNA